MGFYPAYVQRSKGVGKTVLHSRACKYYSWPHRPIQILGDILGRLWLWSSACEEPGAGTCVLGIKPGQTSHSVYLLPDLLSAKRPSVELKNTLLSHFWLSVLFPWHHFESISNRIYILWCWEHQATSHLGKALSTGVCNKTFYQDGWVTLQPWVRRNCSNLHWEPDLRKCAMLGIEYTPLKEGRRWESWPSMSHPQFISICLTALPSPANIYGINNQVKLLMQQPH